MLLVYDPEEYKKPVEEYTREFAVAMGWRQRKFSRWKSLRFWCEGRGWDFRKVLKYVREIKPVVGFIHAGEVWCSLDALKALENRLSEKEVKVWEKLVKKEIAACRADLEDLEGSDLD